MGADLAFLLPMTFVIIIVVILFIYLCTRNSRPKGLFSTEGRDVWGDIKYFFTGPPREEVVVVDIQDEEIAERSPATLSTTLVAVAAAVIITLARPYSNILTLSLPCRYHKHRNLGPHFTLPLAG
ncbi:hypothetical protein Dda_7381 [Drechslerella dactyloides]|uniref:Uncharacterized protein n=1 Tax=Drechslerella dactyloides TaxID=74499 RepID=A0AAD6IVL2_DREDA|nr:hypothetical protein Dda_7381 [Drechslerella dactyloides]